MGNILSFHLKAQHRSLKLDLQYSQRDMKSGTLLGRDMCHYSMMYNF